MKKRVLYTLLIFSMLFSMLILVQAEEDVVNGSQEKIDKAYQCLKDRIKEKSSLSLQDAIFAALALGSDSKINEAIEKDKKSNEACWPKSSCTIKDTAQTLLAYDKIGKDTKGIKDWLLSKTISARDLIWYLEIDIDAHKASDCTIKYDSLEHKINVKEDMTLAGNPGSCFEISYGGYWLKIKESCLDKSFEVSCNDEAQGNFITTLVYQKKTGNTVFVSSETHSSAKGGTTNEKINSKCFATSNKCDYEGTLWATTALKKIGEDTESYIPYLLTLSEDNQKYLSSAFLFILTGAEDKYSELIQKQKLGKYWEIIGSPYNRYYDSALALLALSGTNSNEGEATKNYLLTTQTKEGCWNNNNIRDTSFILYSAWPKSIGGGGNGGKTSYCKEAGNYCEPKEECLNAGGTVTEGLVCENFRELCCTKQVIEMTCQEKGGLICAPSQECDGRIESSLDGSCCIGKRCIEKPVENQCEIAGGTCQRSCLDTEEKLDKECLNYGEVCCVFKEKKEEPTTNYWTFIIILGILIILIIIAIIYRHKIQIWWQSRKKGGTTAPQSRTPPGPFRPMPGPMPRYAPPGAIRPLPQRVAKKISSPQDKEMEETMKKLKEMSE